MKSIPYLYYKQIVLRTPSFPSKYVIRGELDKIVARNDFKNSLAVTSREFFEHLKTSQKTDSDKAAKSVKTLYKYVNRMSFKPAPFSILSGISIGEWDRESKCILNGKKEYIVKLDHAYLVKILDLLEEDNTVQAKIKYYPNNTIYQAHNQLRYLEEVQDGDRRKYVLSGVDTSVYLKKYLH
ncbi:lantibiotic dehydratase [Olivibacter sp. 47]|nr:lantibiotic dehydratase [Olivibacter sp. 47]MDM8173650.1 lantibiotic dehydratase [Olivibacter sp. 47]